MGAIYDLHDDASFIAAVQEATLTTKKYGITQEHGLFASSQWWQAIDSGVLPIQRVNGMVTRVYMSGHNDFPEFEVDDGMTKTKWQRFGDPSAYSVGAPVTIEFVFTKSRFSQENQHTVIRVWLGAKSAA